ncbi:MAG TPA: hypothetical protein P5050_01890 [Bacteroidia bacterium]|nr:hypothetical protein [Bacteroidia bacterium]HRS57954.1 hypothetical protein [Bacteroidia bacterium]HRU67997.1 hypothetical protein [Bacteroidia bacterium]
MKSNTELIFIILLISPAFYSHAQPDFRFGMEAGLTISQPPGKVSYTIKTRKATVTESFKPLISPLFGLTAQLTVFKHFLFSSAFQYQLTGSKEHYHRNDTDMLYGGNYTHDIWKNQQYQKICLPVSAGYKFRISKIYFSASAGFRLNYFLTGKFYSKNLVDYTNKADYLTEQSYSPLDSDWPIKQFDNQLFGSISVFPKQNLQISFSIFSGSSKTFDLSSLSCTPESFVNNDYLLSFTWYIKNTLFSKK